MRFYLWMRELSPMPLPPSISAERLAFRPATPPASGDQRGSEFLVPEGDIETASDRRSGSLLSMSTKTVLEQRGRARSQSGKATSPGESGLPTLHAVRRPLQGFE